MVDKNTRLAEAAKIVRTKLGKDILASNWDREGGQLFFLLQPDIRLYIIYNSYNQYSYHIMKEKGTREFVRFDNYDDRWEVETSPHHYHPYLKKTATKSPMIGLPEKDIPLLCKLIKKQKLFST